MAAVPTVVAYAHDCRSQDGTYQLLLAARSVLEGTRFRTPVYRCVDPSLRREYPTLGTEIAGYRLPFGGDLERGLNRWSRVFPRKLRAVPGDLLHIWGVALGGVLRYRTDVVVTVPDVAKWTTRHYGRVPSYLHNRVLPLVRRARALVVQTEWARQELIQAVGVDAERVRVASPIPSWDEPGPRRSQPASAPTEGSPWHLLYVAVDRPHKNVRFFLQVLAGLGAGFRGRVVTQPTAATLRAVRDLGLGGRVEFLSNVADMRTVYRSSEVLVYPSLYEGFGLPLLEAMTLGLPVLASDRTAVPEVVGDGGRCLPVSDPSAWAAEVRRLVDPTAYAAASEAALRRAAYFTPERLRGALEATYEAALTSR